MTRPPFDETTGWLSAHEMSAPWWNWRAGCGPFIPGQTTNGRHPKGDVIVAFATGHEKLIRNAAVDRLRFAARFTGRARTTRRFGFARATTSGCSTGIGSALGPNAVGCCVAIGAALFSSAM